MKFSIRLLYLYLFSAIGLLIGIIGIIRIVDLGIKIYVFNNADRYTISRPVMAPDMPKSAPISAIDEAQMMADQELEQTRSRQREVASSIAMILVGLPLYFYHWRLIKKEAR
jgi:hypothetical protein